MKILIIDDEIPRARLITRVIQRQMKAEPLLDIVEAKNFNEAIDAFKTNDRFDLVFFDHDLGQGGNGLGVARFVTTELPAEKRPVRALVQSSNPDGALAIVNELEDHGIPARRWSPTG